MSEDRFFQQVNSVMSNYRPEVPETVYAGMRKKLWWSNFTRFSYTSLNVWYLLIAFVAGVTGLMLSQGSAISEQHPMLKDEVVVVTSQEPLPQEATTEIVAEQSSSEKNVVKSNSEETKGAVKSSVQQVPDVSDVQSGEQNSPELGKNEAVVVTPASDPAQVQEGAKKGSKKGLKVKAYESTEKK